MRISPLPIPLIMCIFFTPFLLVVIFSINSFASIETEEAVKHVFIEVENIYRADKKIQKNKIPYLYKELIPKIFFSRYSYYSTPYNLEFADTPNSPPQDLVPEELANWMLANRNDGWMVLMEASKKTSLSILAGHKDILLPLVEHDLGSGNNTTLERALFIIGDLKLNKFYNNVLEIFKTNKDWKQTAVYTLRDLNDPRAIKHLINENKNNPTKYFEILRTLQRQRSADPALVALLSNPDAEIRWKAAYALAECGDVSLIPYLKELVNDNDPRVRKQAANIAFLIEPDLFAEVRPYLVKMLSDKDINVRSFVAIVFAHRKDKVCAHTLLELLKNEEMDQGSHSNIVQAINNLTGSYFGYSFGSDAWQPSTENNQKAIARFSKWIKENIE